MPDKLKDKLKEDGACDSEDKPGSVKEVTQDLSSSSKAQASAQATSITYS